MFRAKSKSLLDGVNSTANVTGGVHLHDAKTSYVYILLGSNKKFFKKDGF